MKFEEVIGIDVSKLTLDACIHSLQIFTQVPNTKKGYSKLFSWAARSTGCSLEQILFCFEHTGMYSYALSCYMSEGEMNYIMVPGLEIKRSLGIQRGKNDQIDARKIAQYAYRRREEVTIYQLPEKAINKIRQLLSLREKLVRQRAGYEASLKDMSDFIESSENRIVFTVQRNVVKTLVREIEKVENEIDRVLAESPDIMNNYKLITSITGVGRQTALQLIVVTNNFVSFDDHRKLASYAGVAPFPYTSGTSIRGKTKVSSLANMRLKSLLSACAVSATRHDPEMKIYFNRRTENGKHKMNSLNAVKNKLLARVFAVVRRGTPYVAMCNYAA